MNAVRPYGRPAGCPTGTRRRTHVVRPHARNVGACWVQNQNQNQSLSVEVSCCVVAVSSHRKTVTREAQRSGASR